MSGPRISSGKDSKQDYATPVELIAAVEKQFGKIVFDLAAHAGNTKHERFFAPPELPESAYGVDALAHDWAPLSSKFRQPDGRPGVLWLNCEFGDIAPWVERCGIEGVHGANIVSILPAMVGANWARDFVFPHADVYFLNGRVSFDGKNVFPKDCMIAHYHSEVRKTGSLVAIWDWRRNNILKHWIPSLEKE